MSLSWTIGTTQTPEYHCNLRRITRAILTPKCHYNIWELQEQHKLMNTVETLHDFACTWCTICLMPPFAALWSSSTSRLSICMNCPRIIDIKQKKRSSLLPHWYQLPHFGWKTILVVMAVLGLWDILLPCMHRPPHLLHLPLLYLTKMCAMWINPAMMEVDYCCHHLHHATSWAWKLDKCCHRDTQREIGNHTWRLESTRENGYWRRAFGLLSECLQHTLDSKALLDRHWQSSAKYHKTWCSGVPSCARPKPLNARPTSSTKRSY